MFNDYSSSLKIRNICKKKKIKLIEDNAIYFDNYTLINNKKFFSGQIGDYTLYSFNIMKHISAFFGGAVATNDKDFNIYFLKETKNLRKFFKIKLFKQIIIFLILKIMSIKILYKIIFIHFISLSHRYNIKFFMKLFYPSLRFKKYPFDRSYFTKVSDLTIRTAYLQILNKKQRNFYFNERKKKNIYYQKKLAEINNANIRLIKIKDFNYQNFIDYPILVTNKKMLNSFLLKRGFELRFIYYKNCESIFSKNNHQCKNSKIFEESVVCLPNHNKINYSYINKLVKNIDNFYKFNLQS
jgi:dTDP-4-amino-4,6-dideoxygalactose transaminase